MENCGKYVDGKYVVPFKVNSHDTDRLGQVRPSVMLRYIHEAANLQFAASHPTLEELRAISHQAFILSKVAMKIHRQLVAYENITATTWAGPSTGVSFLRCGEIRDEAETLVAEAISVWALVDLSRGRFVRVKDANLGLPALDFLPNLPLPGHIHMPDTALMEKAGTRTVYHSDTDLNGHMNNTVYPNMLADFIPGIEDAMITSFAIDYIREAKYGETFQVFCHKEGDTACLRTLKEDGSVGAEALFTVAPSASPRPFEKVERKEEA